MPKPAFVEAGVSTVTTGAGSRVAGQALTLPGALFAGDNIRPLTTYPTEQVAAVTTLSAAFQANAVVKPRRANSSLPRGGVQTAPRRPPLNPRFPEVPIESPFTIQNFLVLHLVILPARIVRENP